MTNVQTINSTSTDTDAWSKVSDLIRQTVNTTGIDVSAIISLIQESVHVIVTDIRSAASSSTTSNITTAEVLLDREIELLESILGGRALINHLEPSYYSALEKILNDMFPV